MCNECSLLQNFPPYQLYKKSNKYNTMQNTMIVHGQSHCQTIMATADSPTLSDCHGHYRLAHIVRLPWPLPTPSHCQIAMATADSLTLSDCHGYCRLAYIVRLPWPLPTRSHCQTAMATADLLTLSDCHGYCRLVTLNPLFPGGQL